MSAFVAPRPFLKWAGGKTKLLPELRKHVPEKFSWYFEPFLGGGALFFDLCARAGEPVEATLSDSNFALMKTYEVVKLRVEELIVSLAHLERTYLEGPESARSLFDEIQNLPLTSKEDPIAVAARLIFLNKTCFNGLWRTNKQGKFNVPWGKYVKPTICDAENLRACSFALRDAHLFRSEFWCIGDEVDPEDFMYFDPPYWPVSKTASFTAYGPNGFGPRDQRHLRDFAAKRKDEGAKVLLSNADVPEVRALYLEPEDGRPLFEIERVEVARSINSKGDSRGKVGELLIW